jgi:hypothetical protein
MSSLKPDNPETRDICQRECAAFLFPPRAKARVDNSFGNILERAGAQQRNREVSGRPLPQQQIPRLRLARILRAKYVDAMLARLAFQASFLEVGLRFQKALGTQTP